jgi:hypothetical protein
MGDYGDEEGAEQDTALTRAVQYWAAVKPADAVAWGHRLSSPHLRAVAADAIADTRQR